MTSANKASFSATTYGEVLDVCYKWTICNISFFLKDTEKWPRSTCFKSSEKTIWNWSCFITYKSGFLHFGLVAHDLRYERIPAQFKFSLFGPKEEVPLVGMTYHIFDSRNRQCIVQSSLHTNDMLKHKTGPGDTLTIVCHVQAMISQETADTLSVPACKMQDDLQTFLNDQQFTDVTLVVEGHSIKAHKAMLAARSPVFAAMFSADMEESRQNQVTISDMKHEVAQNLLQFIYTGKTDIDSTTVDQLFVAADKYGLMQLKAQCEQTILSSLTVPTAIETLIFADRMKAEQLKSRTMKFIKTNMDKVVEHPDWKTMAVEHPTLLVEVCRTLASA